MRLKLYRGTWAATWREQGKTRRISLGTPDRAGAERALADLKRKPTGDTISEVMAAYLVDKQGTARSYGSMVTAWRALEPYFAALRPDQITRDLCRHYAKARRRGGVADGTIIKDLGVLKAAVNWAGKSAGAVFDMPHAPPPRDRYLTREEFSRLVDACVLPHVQLFVILAWSTAGRATAILELTWDRVDFQRGHIRLAKGGGRRKGRATVPMTKLAREALEAAAAIKTCDHVIEWGGKPLRSMKRSFETACRLGGIEDATPHVMRHSAAVRMAEDGVPIIEIAQFLGHTDPTVTYRVYARFSPDHLRRAANALE